MDNRYLQIARRIEASMKMRGGSASSETDEKVMHLIATAPWSIDFDEVADEYNAIYWTRNFWKAAYYFSYDYTLTPSTLQRLMKDQSLQVTFIGGGAGADVLALMTWFNSSFPMAKLKITVLDISQAQLDLLSSFVAETKELLSDADISVQYVQMDTQQWEPIVNANDMLVLGHFLTENREQLHTLLLKSSAAVRNGGDVVVIERPNDATLLHAKQILANSGLTVHDTTTDEARMALILKQISRPGTSGVTARYLRATQPDTKRKAEIISTYFQAWRQQVIEPLHDIFSPAGSFDYKPGRVKAVNGIEEMVAYWQDKPMRQSDIKLLVRNVAYTENVAVCAFEADLNTPVAHKMVRGALNFSFDNYSNKIKSMTAHYGVMKTPL